MLKESIPTASATTASSTVFRITWAPLIGSPASSTVTGRNVSSPNSSIGIACVLLVEVGFVWRDLPGLALVAYRRAGQSVTSAAAALSSYLSAQTSWLEALFLRAARRALAASRSLHWFGTDLHRRLLAASLAPLLSRKVDGG